MLSIKTKNRGVYMKRIRVFNSIVVATLLFTGCATSELQTSAKMTQSVFINPVAKNKRIIFVSSKNTSGQKIDLENTLIHELEAKGYIIVDDPEMATYILMTNVLYCDKKDENNAAGGALAGGATGVGVSAYNHNSGGQMVGVAIGGALLGGLIAKATEDTIFQMQVDIVIREKANSVVASSSLSASGQANVGDSQKAGFVNSFGGAVRPTDSTGKLNSNLANANAQEYETNYIEHKTMLFAEATKMDLTLAEATPILEKQISIQIAGLF